ncbi:hypothetical protein GP486_006458 [Trichoglossum hirsutum]|uniref:Uncharacterized protein n=1 Tax=Trichoglossum hirsutum TaxID=265104 RepID=A0A9P8IK37_9PEZI|nr:hypothetical protein GP486_006458 [Trichoglossum hirsutum]
MKEPQRQDDIRPGDVLLPVLSEPAIRVSPPPLGGSGRLTSVANPTQSHGEQVFAEENPYLVLQPETRPISQEQLIAEVKSIYAGLVMVEAKCADVDNNQARDMQEAEPGKQPKLDNKQWQALIALHRMLLREHHDFFLASQHPSASPALRRLASKYAMPARMWRHGIHSFPELLRHPLPDSPERMPGKTYLPISLNGIWVDAIPDTGSSRNVISGNFARANCLPIHRTPAGYTRTFRFANRNLKRSAGRCLLDWKFADEPYNTYSSWFEVLEGLPHDVVIGSPLLRETETMSKNAHRLRRHQKPSCLSNFFSVNSIGLSQQRLIATLNGSRVSTLPDTGSERNIISESYAWAHGLQIHNEPRNRVWLVFADGSVRQTVGQVEAYLGLDDNPFHDFPVTFDVLRDCAYDVIIGDEILYEKEVFSQYGDCLEDTWTECDYDEFSLVGLAIFEGCFSNKHRAVHEDPQTEWTLKATIEAERRIEIERTLGLDRTTPAWRRELRRRARWELHNPPPASLPLPPRPVAQPSHPSSAPITRLTVAVPPRARRRPQDSG